MAKVYGVNSIESFNYGFRNAIQGGDFASNPWQRGTSVSSGADSQNIKFADRWVYEQTSTVRVTLQKTADAPTVAQAGLYTDSCAHLDVTTADASVAAGDYVVMYHIIEGYVYKDLAQKPMVLSFWVKSTKTGTFSVAMKNSGNDRNYLLEYTVNASNTWEKKILTIPASPSSGTWNYTNGQGLLVLFAVMCGSNFTGTPSAGTWGTGAYKFASTNQVNGVDSATNDFKIALVQLESGTTATEFENRDFATELKICQRYLCKTFPLATAPAVNLSATGALYAVSPSTSSFTMGNSYIFPVPMRTTPSITTYKPGASNGSNDGYSNDSNGTNITVGVYGMERNGVYIANSATTTAQTSHNVHVLASAELT